MLDVILVVRLAIEGDALDIEILLAQVLCLDRKGIAIGEMQGELRHLRSSKDILAAHRIDRIESHCRKHIPCRHLSTVVVAAESVRQRLVLGVEDLSHNLGCLVRMASQLYIYITWWLGSLP